MKNSKLGESRWALCGNVKLGNHTVVQMVHWVRNTKNGLKMRSRFGVGRELPWIARKIGVSEESLSDLSHHCLTEYIQLASFLPEIYAKYGKN